MVKRLQNSSVPVTVDCKPLESQTRHKRLYSNGILKLLTFTHVYVLNFLLQFGRYVRAFANYDRDKSEYLHNSIRIHASAQISQFQLNNLINKIK